ncbi:MAG: dihydrofolate synthase/folylpolyglutamate synthase [Myxococcota bacterium]|jgi:dihydrofolate synthase/folylpolyglutamate synthase
MTTLARLFNELCLRTDYEQCRRPRAARFSLQSMKSIMTALGDPHLQVPAIHVAGSKGKGSVAYYLSWALQRAGKNVGLYTSPHLSDWRERIQLNGSFANDDALCAAMEAVLDVAPDDATFFDLLTATAFQVFSNQQLDCMVIETGLGGRFDSTNVLQPMAAVITALELEHTDVLGETLSEIAKEKGGIFKPNTPLWCAASIDSQAKLVLHQIANALGDELKVGPRGELASPQVPKFAPSNRALAVAILESLGREYVIAAQLLRVADLNDLGIPGRFELRYTSKGRPVIFDVAHSQQSLAETLRCFRANFAGEQRAVLLALRDDKDEQKLAAAMHEVPNTDAIKEQWYCCAAGSHPRSARADKIAPAFNAKALTVVDFPQGEQPLLVTGSTYLVGALRDKTISPADVARI